MHQPKAHYVPLDSIRGLAALCVVIHHFVISEPLAAVLPHKAWIDVGFFHNSWLFVDLFFVLSGIVISINYVQSEFGAFDFREFVVRRVARIYPLHLFMLLAFLAFRLTKLSLVSAGLLHFAPAEMDVNNTYSFVINVLLLHALGFVDYLSWNGPSWSISAEFYTYLIFAGVVVLAQKLQSVRMLYLASLALVVGSWLFILLVLEKQSLEFQADGIARCILSYFVGVLTIPIVALLKQSAAAPRVQTAWQVGAALAAVAMVLAVGTDGRLSFLAPIVFAVLLGSLMVYPARALPQFLSARPLVWLGKRSYSIYMVHALVLVLVEYFVRGVGTQRLGAIDHLFPGTAATLLLFVLVGSVLAISNLTFAYVEMPGSKAVIRLLRREPGKRIPAAEGKAIGQ